MADPLSIAASVAGLLALSSKIIHALCSFTKSAVEVPQSVSRVNAEVQMVSAVFGQVQRLILSDRGELDEERFLSIPLHSLVDTLTGCVVIFSNLERYIDEIGGLAMPALWERVKWVKRESEIEGLMQDLQRHKLSLNLMLSIILCESSIDARKAAWDLSSAMRDIVENAVSNELKNVFPRLESSTGTSRGLGDSTSITSRKTTATIRDVDDTVSINSTTIGQIRPVKLACESVLRESRVYRQEHLWSNSTVSLATSSRKRSSWSTLSELSLGALSLSEISVFELPIGLSDVWNAEHYQKSEKPPSSSVSLASPNWLPRLPQQLTRLEAIHLHGIPRKLSIPHFMNGIGETSHTNTILPLIKGLNFYTEVSFKVKAIWYWDIGVKSMIRKLCMENALFQNTCENLLTGVLDREQVLQLMSGKGWDDPTLLARLLECMGLKVVEAIFKATEQMRSRLHELKRELRLDHMGAVHTVR
ncbi:hypothetical protein K440DRAFT_687158 [Wilcoxina mikolae CBS 423.85]|nr:hypothetical protein K440DRAFT_687158 [Wilcoxina mikolae CBS 423.85]